MWHHLLSLSSPPLSSCDRNCWLSIKNVVHFLLGTWLPHFSAPFGIRDTHVTDLLKMKCKQKRYMLPLGPSLRHGACLLPAPSPPSHHSEPGCTGDHTLNRPATTVPQSRSWWSASCGPNLVCGLLFYSLWLRMDFTFFKGCKKKKDMTETMCGWRSLKYLPLGPLQSQFGDPCPRENALEQLDKVKMDPWATMRSRDPPSDLSGRSSCNAPWILGTGKLMQTRWC